MIAPYLAEIEHAFRTREERLEARLCAERLERRRREERIRAFSERTKDAVLPCLREITRFLATRGHEGVTTTRGLAASGGELPEACVVRFSLQLKGRGVHAFPTPGDASLAFLLAVSSGQLTVESRIIGRDLDSMSPYRESLDRCRESSLDELNADLVAREVADFLKSAIMATLDPGEDGAADEADPAHEALEAF